MLLTALYGSLVGGAEAGLDLSDMPRSICGWPSLHEGGKFPEWNTRMAQYLLGYALEESIEADGEFTSETTDEISRYYGGGYIEIQDS